MISKSNLLEYLTEPSLFLVGGSTTIVLFSGFNPWHGVIGAVGQLIYLIMEYLRAFNSGKELKKKTTAYWFAVLVLGAAMGYLGTGWVSDKIGTPEIISGIGLGVFAQILPELYDLAVGLFIGFLKKKYGSDE